jgi:hypothetical protein
MTTEVFDFLINAEVIVDDVDVAERVFVDALGFPEPRPSWSGKEPGYGFTFLFARVHPKLKLAPTRIEAMAIAPVDQAVDPIFTLGFLPDLLSTQGDRPWKTHANEVATSDIAAVAARLRSRGCSFYEIPRGEQNPNARLWLGWTEDAPGKYRPDDDGGLYIEVCETEAISPNADIFEPMPEPDLAPGSMVRVLRRSWIVPDMAATLAALQQNFGWLPARGPHIDDHAGARRALLRFAHPRSAELELLEPVGPGEIEDSLRAWGRGAWSITIGVNDLEAKAADLVRRGMEIHHRTQPGGATAVGVDTGALGVPGRFEFAEV